MDTLHSILFYVFSAAALAGAGLTVLFSSAERRALGLALLGLGLAGLYADLSAGFVGLVALVCYLAMAAVIGGPALRGVLEEPSRSFAQHLAGPSMAIVFIATAYAVFRADFENGAYPGGSFGSAALGRVLFGRDAPAAVAAAALVLCAVAAASALRRGARR